jgi:protein transport protein SEC20
MMTTVMGTSKQLITALEKSDWLDRLLIITALIFFFLVVLFILKQRIVDRGLRIALWWTRLLPTGNMDNFEKGGGVIGTAGVVVSTVMASASPTLAGFSRTGSDALDSFSTATVDATPSSPLSSVVASMTDPLRTSTDPVDSRLSIHDEL